MFDPKKVNNDLMLLSPYFRLRLENALREVHEAGYDLFVFEGWRSPSRQGYLYEQGRTRPGGVVTNAKPWQSWHQFSVACDLVYKIGNKWTWEGDFDKPSVIMKSHGFEWLGGSGDKPHYQITGGLSLREAKTITDMHGIQALWQLIENIFVKNRDIV